MAISVSLSINISTVTNSICRIRHEANSNHWMILYLSGISSGLCLMTWKGGQFLQVFNMPNWWTKSFSVKSTLCSTNHLFKNGQIHICVCHELFWGVTFYRFLICPISTPNFFRGYQGNWICLVKHDCDDGVIST